MGCDKISRRDFMGRTAGATLAASAIGGRVFKLEASPIPMPARPAPASDRVRFGMIGVGMRGSDLMATSIRLPGVECAMACDLWDGRVTLAKEIGGASLPVTKRYQDILDNKEIDCIIAAVPDHWHKQIVVDAVSAGKDVYVEKPMTHEVPQGFEIIAAAQRHNRIVQCGSQEPSSVVYQKAKELLAQNIVGDLCLVESSLGRNSPCGAWEYGIPSGLSPQTLDWETWLGSAPKIPFNKDHWARWRCWQAYGEGVSGDLFVHSITGIHFVLGVMEPPARALSTGGLFRWHDGRDVPDVLTTTYEYPGFRVTMRVTLNTDDPEVYRFMGTRGILQINGIENPSGFSISPQDGKDHSPCTPAWPRPMAAAYGKKWRAEHAHAPGTAQPVEIVNYQAPRGYDDTRDHLWNYFQSVRTRRPSVEGPEFANAAAIACHMANFSYFNKGVAVWDASRREIVKG
jgi:predicted dehydrogenase